MARDKARGRRPLPRGLLPAAVIAPLKIDLRTTPLASTLLPDADDDEREARMTPPGGDESGREGEGDDVRLDSGLGDADVSGPGGAPSPKSAGLRADRAKPGGGPDDEVARDVKLSELRRASSIGRMWLRWTGRERHSVSYFPVGAIVACPETCARLDSPSGDSRNLSHASSLLFCQAGAWGAEAGVHAHGAVSVLLGD